MSTHNSIQQGDEGDIPEVERGFAPQEINDSDEVFEVIDKFLSDIEEAATDEEMQEIVQDYLDKASNLSLWNYSFNNQAAILSQMAYRTDVDFNSTATHFAGYRQWMNDYGRHVKEGEKGFKIIAPVTGPVCPDCRNSVTGYGPEFHADNDWLDCDLAGTDPDEWDFDPTEQWRTGVWFFKIVTVFAYEQTAPIEDAGEDEVFEPLDWSINGEANRLKPAIINAVTEEFEINVEVQSPEEYSGRPGSKGYTRLDGTIYAKDNGNNADICSTLIHELAHELIHGDSDEDTDREKREVEAECVSYATCRYFDLNADSSALYVARWNGDERDTLKARLRRVRKTAAQIIKKVEKHID